MINEPLVHFNTLCGALCCIMCLRIAYELAAAAGGGGCGFSLFAICNFPFLDATLITTILH